MEVARLAHRSHKSWFFTGLRAAVQNQDLWERLDELAARHELEWHWVPGHAGVPGNERVDRLANEAIDALQLRSLR